MISKKIITFLSLILLIGLLSCATKLQVNSSSEYDAGVYRNIRKLQRKGKIDSYNFIDYLGLLNYASKGDTVYVLESWCGEGFYNLVAWNRSDTIWGGGPYVETDYSVNRYLRFEDPMFPLYMMHLISRWDIDGLKQEEKENPSTLINPRWIDAARIIFREGRYDIDTFSFGDFFKKGRDGEYP